MRVSMRVHDNACHKMHAIIVEIVKRKRTKMKCPHISGKSENELSQTESVTWSKEECNDPKDCYFMCHTMTIA